MPGFFATAQLLTTDVFYSAAWMVTALLLHSVLRVTTPRTAQRSWVARRGAASALDSSSNTPRLLLVPGLAWSRPLHAASQRSRSGVRLGTARSPRLRSLIVASPVLVWNAQHGWPTIAHQLGRLRLPGGDESVDWKWSPCLVPRVSPLRSSGCSRASAVLIVATRYERRRVATLDERATRTLLRSLSVSCRSRIYLVLSLFVQTQGNWAIAGYAAAGAGRDRVGRSAADRLATQLPLRSVALVRRDRRRVGDRDPARGRHSLDARREPD